MNVGKLKESIRASEGRTILSENVVTQRVMDDITTSEVVAAFGADLILLNLFDVFNPVILSLYVGENDMKTAKAHKDGSIIRHLQRLVGRPIGVNLEPVDPLAHMREERSVVPEGRTASVRTLRKCERLGFNFVCLTGNPGSGVSNEQIAENVKLAKSLFSGLIIAGKMHSSGVDEPVVSTEAVKKFLAAGADVILVPAVGTVPGFRDEALDEIVAPAHKRHALVMSTIGTSQEGSGAHYIENIAIRNKVCGVDSGW
jgi:hypothetical protein